MRSSVRQTTHPFCKCLFNQLIVSAAYKLIYFLLIEKDKLLCTTQLSRFFLQMALTQSINQSAGKSTITITKLGCLLNWQYHHFSEEVSSEFSIPKPISKESTVINFHQSHRFQMLEMPKGGFGHDPLLLMISLKDRMLAICSFLEVRCVVIALKTRHQNRIDWKNALRLSPMVICRYFSFLTRAKKRHSALCNKSFRSVVVILDLGQWALVEVLLPTRYSDCHKKSWK